MERIAPSWVRCFEDVICSNCVFYMKHPDPDEIREGLCKCKCDADREVRLDDWCGEGKWIYGGELMPAEDAPLFVKARDEVNKK
jgi:hypothetical protein